MRRREFITFVGSSAVAWPLAAHAQRQPMPVIGFLNGQSAATFQYLVAAFQTGLSENGFVENQNVTTNIGGRMGTSSGCLNSPPISFNANQRC